MNGDNIVAAINGTVSEISLEGNLGKHLKIENRAYMTVYAHCNDILVEKGKEVNQGDIVATVGSTGNSTGNHLHFEVLKNAEYIDPLSVIEK